jgi:uncharacterized protein (DUF169 family)
VNLSFKNKFLVSWEKYFGTAELPIVFFYSENKDDVRYKDLPRGWSCLISELMKVRKGESLAYNIDNIACGGAKRFLGYSEKMRDGFEYFLSTGNEEAEGERHKCSPELVKGFEERIETLPANGRYSIFKRWDLLEESDEPEVVIFFATPDVLSGLFTLANFDELGENGVVTPFGAGCGSIIYHPYREGKKEHPKCVIGMFDISARPGVERDVLSFAVPIKRFEVMVENMDKSFLTTDSWMKVRKRINR